ncbi:MAG TPA: hypothetical protein DEB39_14760 [Planctomycetaceae bacterium]|nr:hypothetical protein [Planctomycetaceae bacterium]
MKKPDYKEGVVMKPPLPLQYCFVLTTALFLNGCGEKLPPGMPSPVPCDVIVTQEGKTLPGAVVRLHPIEGGSWSAAGLTDESGKAVLYTMDRFKGAVSGKYKVIVSKTEFEPGDAVPGLRPGETATPEMMKGLRLAANFYVVEERYGNEETTPLVIEVAKGTRMYIVDVGKAVRIKIKER